MFVFIRVSFALIKKQQRKCPIYKSVIAEFKKRSIAYDIVIPSIVPIKLALILTI